MKRRVVIAAIPFIIALVAGCTSVPDGGTPDGSGEPGMRRDPPAVLNPGEPISLNALSYTNEELATVNRLALSGASLVLPERWRFLPPTDGAELTRPEVGATAFYFSDPTGTITGQVQRFIAPFRSEPRYLAEYYINAIRPAQEIIRTQPITIAGLRGFVVFLDATERETGSVGAPMVMTLILDAGEAGQVSVEVADITGGIENDPLPVLQLMASLSVSHPGIQERTLPAGITFADPEHEWSWIGDLGGGMILYPTASEAPYTVVIAQEDSYADEPLATLIGGPQSGVPVEMETRVASEIVSLTAHDRDVAGRRCTVADFEAAGRAWRMAILHRRSTSEDVETVLTSGPLITLLERNLVFAWRDAP